MSISDFIDYLRVEDCKTEDIQKIDEMCSAYNKYYEPLSETIIVFDYVRLEIPFLATPAIRFYHQSEEAKEYLDHNFIVNDEAFKNLEYILGGIKQKVETYHQYHQQHDCRVLRIIDFYKPGRKCPFSYSYIATPIFNNEGVMIGAMVRVETAHMVGDNMLIIYDYHQHTGLELRPNGTWKTKNYDLLDETDRIIIRMLINGYSEKDISNEVNLTLYAVKFRLRMMRKRYEVPTTRSLIIKLHILEII